MAESPLTCSFCGQPPEQVHFLITGHAANICDQCVDCCTEIIADERANQLLRAGERECDSWFGGEPSDG
jgi:ATP-dependent protease Clp ATPase subunit